MPSSVVIVEDNNVVRGCLEELVNSIDGFTCLATFGCAEDAIRMVPRLAPDLVMMDIQLPNLSGIECAAKLKASLPALLILMLTVYEDEEKIFEAFKAGASGYILKRAKPSEVVQAIKDMLGGGVPMTSTIARKVVERSARSLPTRPMSPRSRAAKSKSSRVCPRVYLTRTSPNPSMSLSKPCAGTSNKSMKNCMSTAALRPPSSS